MRYLLIPIVMCLLGFSVEMYFTVLKTQNVVLNSQRHFIEEFNKQGHSFTLRENDFSHLNPDEFRSLVLNKFLSKGDSTPNPPFTSRKLGSNLPKSFDWRDKGVVTPVLNQGYCGSCYAFATISSIESSQLIYNRSVGLLSQQDILDATTGFGNYGCDGGYETVSFNYVSKNGIAKSDDYPYEDGLIMNQYQKGQRKVKKFQRYGNVVGYSGILYGGTEEQLQEALYERPVAVGVDASLTTFHLYGGKIYDDVGCNNTLNHLVLAVGWGEENGVKYWIIKNSWGTKWGENGYMRLLRGSKMCGIGERFSYPVIDVNLPPYPSPEEPSKQLSLWEWLWITFKDLILSLFS